MTYKHFDPNQLSVVLGLSPISGFAEDTMITIEYEDAPYKLSHDIHGNPIRSRVNKNTAKITIILTQNSKSNDVLSNYVELDRVNDAGIFPVIIKDPSGTSLFSCEHAFVLETPKVEYGQEAKNREWVISASNMSQYVGGY